MKKVIIKTIVKNKMPQIANSVLDERIGHILDLNIGAWSKINTIDKLKKYIQSIAVSAIEYIIKQEMIEVQSESKDYSDFNVEIKNIEDNVNKVLREKFEYDYCRLNESLKNEYEEKRKQLDEEYNQRLEELAKQRAIYTKSQSEIRQELKKEFDNQVNDLNKMTMSHRRTIAAYEEKINELYKQIEEFREIFDKSYKDSVELDRLKEKINKSFFAKLFIKY